MWSRLGIAACWMFIACCVLLLLVGPIVWPFITSTDPPWTPDLPVGWPVPR